MTAGTGILHDERNPNHTPARCLQAWFTPDARGLTPAFRDIPGGGMPEEPAGDGARRTVVPPGALHLDAALYDCTLPAGGRAPVAVGEGRSALFYVLEGQAELDGSGLGPGQGAAAQAGPAQSVTVAAPAGARWVVYAVGA